MRISIIHVYYFLLPGKTVVEVKATDADDPTTANAELRYSLTHGDISAFEIDSITGRLTPVVPTMIAML